MEKEESLLYSASRGNTEELLSLLRDGANIHYENEYGDNALHIAAKNGKTEAVRILLEAGAMLYSVNRYGHNPLIVAAMECHSDVVRVLLEFSKKTSTRTNPSVVAVMAANSLESRGCTDVADMLRSNPG